jgi:hypothetical protein
MTVDVECVHIKQIDLLEVVCMLSVLILELESGQLLIILKRCVSALHEIKEEVVH